MKVLSSIREIRQNGKSERCFIYLCCFIWASVIMSYFYAFVMHIGPISFMSTWIGPSIITILSIGAIPYFRKNVRLTTGVLFLSFFSIYLLNYLIYPENEIGLDRYSTMFYTSLPMIFIGQCIKLDKVERIFYFISILNIISCALYFLFYTQSETYDGSAITGDEGHNMGAAYKILPHVLFVAWQMYKHKTIFSIAITVLGFLLISSFGTRGPMVCVILFNAIYLLFIKKFDNPVRARMIIALVAVMIIVFLTDIMSFMGEFVVSLGMSDRIFQIALDGNFVGGEASADSRVYIAETTLNMIKRSTELFGYGIAALDRVLGTYPHNFWIEMPLSFGIVPGILLIIILIYNIIKKYLTTNSDDIHCFLLLLVCSSLMKLSFSYTFITDPFLFMLIGFIIVKAPIINKKAKC